MKLFLCALPIVLGQTWGDQQPLTLYNNADPRNANCAIETSPCECHYASCSLSGDCVCGWDESTQTCRAGISTACASCPGMRRCGVNQKLKIGPNGFPVPGQLSVWGLVPYPDGSMPRSSGSNSNAQIQGQSQFIQQPNQIQGQGQFIQQPTQMQQSQMWQAATALWQAATAPVWQSSTWQQPVTPAPQWQAAPAQSPNQEFVGAPLTLYQDNVLSAGGCAAKTNPCDCHYASCTQSGDCLCGWDASSRTCRAGIPTQCASCPSMRRCGVSQKLKIGPNGFPVPGQLSVWGQVPYPDETANSLYSGQMGGVPIQAAPVAPVPVAAPLQPAGGKAGKGGKGGKGNVTNWGM